MDEAVLVSMAQMLGMQLRPEVVRRLMPDAEYALREVICAAKAFMRHAKRNRLAQDDVSMATKLFDSMLSRRNRSERFLLLSNGVRYPVSNVKSLAELYKNSLPQHQAEVSLHSSWLTEELQGEEDPNPSSIAEATAGDKSSPQQSRQNGGGVPSHDTAELKQKSIEETVTDLIALVHTHISPTGRPEVVMPTVDVVAGLLTQDLFEMERHRDDLLRCALTCIIGNYPRMSASESWEARQRVIVALAQWKHETTDITATGRVCKTLFAAMLDQGTPLDSVCGAMTGIVAFGETTYHRYLTPHLPALLHSLESRLGETISRAGEDTQQTVERICQILSRTIERITPAD